MTILWTLGSVFLVSLIAFVGVALFLSNAPRTERWLLPFVSFSVGALLGDVFLHMLPEMVEESTAIDRALLVVLAGILLSFVLEKVIHWRHCHSVHCEGHVHPMGMLNIIGDAVHNFIDGMLIAGSFLVSVPLGIATTVAVVLHEIPQEISDMAILLHSGYSRRRAITLNALSAFVAILGAAIILVLGSSVSGLTEWLIPLTAGNFLYIAGSDLIPELHKETTLKHVFLQFFLMILGTGVMYMLTYVETATAALVMR